MNKREAKKIKAGDRVWTNKNLEEGATQVVKILDTEERADGSFMFSFWGGLNGYSAASHDCFALTYPGPIPLDSESSTFLDKYRFGKIPAEPLTTEELAVTRKTE